MKSLFFKLACVSCLISVSQPDTEVFLFDLKKKGEQISISNYVNASSNEGYDNQPSFLDNNTLLYASTRKGQTDIARYSLNYSSKVWLNYSEGSEYSPLKIPGKRKISAIRLDKDGTQALYAYNLSNGEAELLIDEPVIGYHVWYTEDILVSAILDEEALSLVTHYLKEDKYYKLQKKIGRSLHKIPGTDLISYISKEDENTWEIKSMDPISGATKGIMVTLPGSEDMCWLEDGTILMGHESSLYAFNREKDVDWREVADLTNFGIKNITRLAVRPDGTKLALVGEGGLGKKDQNPETAMVYNEKTAKKLKPIIENVAWIAGNWKGEAFGGKVEENWSEPSGGSMMAAFKLVKDGKTVFYEIEIIREVENTLILQLKHFNYDLKGWETKDETIDFPLIQVWENKVEFEGMSFVRNGPNKMTVFVDLETDGKVSTLKIEYNKN